MGKIFWIIVAIVLIAAAGFGGFTEGKAYQSSQAAQIRNQFLQARGINSDSSGNQSSGSRGAGFGGGFGGGVTGRIKNIQGDTLDLSTSTNVTTVDLSANTLIVKNVPGARSDLQPGEQLVVRGSRNSDGSVVADQIQIVNNSSAQASAQRPPAP